MTDSDDDGVAPVTRRDYMKLGGLAAGGVLGTGVAGAAGVGPRDALADLSPGIPVSEGPVAYLFYTGANIEGEPFPLDVNERARTASRLFAVDWSVESVVERESRGRPTTTDVFVAKPLDPASVPLYQRFQAGQNLGDVEIAFYRPTGGSDGAPVNYLRLRLVSPLVTGIRHSAQARDGPDVLELVSVAPQEVAVIDAERGSEARIRAQRV